MDAHDSTETVLKNDLIKEPVPWISEDAPKLVVGLTGSRSYRAAVIGYRETGLVPHMTVDLDNRMTYVNVQTRGACHMYSPGHPLAPHRNSKAFFLNITRNPGDIITDEEADYLNKVVNMLRETLNVPAVLLDGPGSVSLAHKNVISTAAFAQFSGVINSVLIPDGKHVSSFTMKWLEIKEGADSKEPVAAKKTVKKSRKAAKKISKPVISKDEEEVEDEQA